MTLEYPTEYKDSKGFINSTIITDGKSIWINLRGTDFQGIHFWELYLINKSNLKLAQEFSLSEEGSLSEYAMKIKMPIKAVAIQNIEIDATIEFEMNNEKIKITIRGETYILGRPNFEYGLKP